MFCFLFIKPSSHKVITGLHYTINTTAPRSSLALTQHNGQQYQEDPGQHYLLVGQEGTDSHKMLPSRQCSQHNSATH